MNRELAVRRDEPRREILDPDTGPSRDDHHIGIGEQSCKDRFRVIADQPGEVDRCAVTRSECGQHGSVGVSDLKPGRR